MSSLIIAYALAACGHDEPAKDPSVTGSTTSDGTTAQTVAANQAPPPPPSATHATATAPVVTATATATTTSATPPPPAPTSNHPPDNTGINERDRGNTATPLTQGNSDAEVKITAAIRRSVMGDGSLGFNAKNVKIITVGTKVTLRGPVANDHERSAIEAYAKQTAGVTAVDNQLEVKN